MKTKKNLHKAKKASLLLLFVLFGSLVIFNSCGGGDDNDSGGTTPPPGDNEIAIDANITENTTWKTGNVYILASRIAVESGVTLTIEPGVIVKGEAGRGANATALLVARGGKILAEGTASSPIIFTSVADEIKPGEIESPNLAPDENGLWGGVLILGNAPISASASPKAIEGIPANDPNGLYGGDNADDNSGVLKFVSIRHGGSDIGASNEINGLTLGGVGSGTFIENIEIVANQDDGIEWFGGTVNVKNALIWNTGDDAVDTDQGWIGTLDNFIIISPEDKCFELDGPEGAAVTANHKIMNGTVQAATYDDNGEVLRSAVGLVDNDADNTIADTNVDMSNIYFFNLKAGQTFDAIPTYYGSTFTALEATIPEGTSITDFFLGGSDAFTAAVAAGVNTVGANASMFDGWSWAATAGVLNF